MEPAAMNCVVAIFEDHPPAGQAVRLLQRGGFDMKRLSIIGRDCHTDEHVVGYYNTGDRMRYMGRLGAFWGSIWGLLPGAAFFWLPGIGPVMVAGPIVAWLLTVLQGNVLPAGVGMLSGALASIGIPQHSVLKYETDLRARKYLLFAHGTTQEVEKARRILLQSRAAETLQMRLRPRARGHVHVTN